MFIIHILNGTLLFKDETKNTHAHKHEKAQLTSYQGSTTYHLLNNTLELTK